MEDQHSEEEAEVDVHVILVGQVEGVEHQEANDECHLDGEHKDSSVENIHLIVLLQLELFLVFLHERAVANSVHVGSQLHIFWSLTSGKVI